MNTCLILQQVSQEIQVFLLCFLILPELPENTVPLIYNNNKWTLLSLINILHGFHQIRIVKIIHIRIFSLQIPQNKFFYPVNQCFNTIASTQKLLHIQKNGIILISVLFKIRTLGYFKFGKYFSGITASAVICRKHIRSHGFSKPPRAADADISLHCIHYPIRVSDQTSFIYVDFRIYAFFKALHSRIQISAHSYLLCPYPFPYSYSVSI